MKYPIPYRRIAGFSGVLARYRLWLGPDHLLFVKTSLLAQEYRRFYYRDIQAITITEVEDQSRFWAFLLAAIAAVFSAGLAFSYESFWALPIGVACVILFLFALSKSNARCSLTTRAGAQLLPSLKTLERARAVTALLRTEIHRSQQVIPAESFAVQPPIQRSPSLPASRPYRGLLHYAAFVLMLLIVVMRLFRPPGFTPTYAVIGVGMDLLLLVLAIGAAVNQRGSAVPRLASNAISLTLVWLALSFFGGELLMITRLTAIVSADALPNWRDPAADFGNTILVLYAVAGLAGLIALFTQKPVRKAQGA